MEKPLLIKAGGLIDGKGSSARHDVLVEVRDGRIRNITDKTLFKKSPMPHDAVDLSGCTLIPGLVDSHVHLTMSGTLDQEARDRQLRAGYREAQKMIGRHIACHFSYGVLAVRDCGDPQGFTLEVAKETAQEKRLPVVLKLAGKAWRTHGRYGKLIGRPPRKNQPLSEAVAGALGRADLVKIVNSGLNSLTEYGKQTPPQFGTAELGKAVCRAKEAGLRVMVHANGIVPVAVAIEADCDSIEHGFFMGEENLKKMAEKKITWVPTAVTMAAYAGFMGKDSPMGKVAEKNLAHQLAQISLARELGVPIALGTDAGSPDVNHGRAVIDEMKLFMQAGFTIEETVQCAAKNGADLLDLDRPSHLSKGMPATFIAVKGAPSDLPDSLNSIERIYIDGEKWENFKSPPTPLFQRGEEKNNIIKNKPSPPLEKGG